MEAALLDIAYQWIATGELSTDNGTLLKAQYLSDIGAPKGCKTCGNVWSDIKHHFGYKLKLLNRLPVAKSIRKFIIAGAGFLMLPGASKTIVNDGENSEDREVLTDIRAEEILAEYPSYDQLIVINPVWAAANAELEESDEADDDHQDDDDESEELTTAKAQIVDLTAKNEALTKENEQLKEDKRVLKGQLTRTQNQLAAKPSLAPQTVPPAVPADPANATDAGGKTGAATTVDTGAASGDQSSTGEQKGNEAANSTAAVVEGAQA